MDMTQVNNAVDSLTEARHVRNHFQSDDYVIAVNTENSKLKENVVIKAILKESLLQVGMQASLTSKSEVYESFLMYWLLSFKPYMFTNTETINEISEYVFGHKEHTDYALQLKSIFFARTCLNKEGLDGLINHIVNAVNPITGVTTIIPESIDSRLNSAGVEDDSELATFLLDNLWLIPLLLCSLWLNADFIQDLRKAQREFAFDLLKEIKEG